tara:strand:- start:8202 stop:9509 length:1308 start_codon:yes stop_codon:yes gene_type:complete
MSTIKIYKDVSANSIFIEDNNGAQFLNSLQATVPSTTVTITDMAKQIDIVSNADHTQFVDENDSPYTGTATQVCDQLNAIFQSSGTPTNEDPDITSGSTINLVQGQTLNYTLLSDYGVAYEWENLPSSVSTVEGNVRKLIGGSLLTAGTYPITARAINYNGIDELSINIIVTNPSFANTKSVQFNQNDFLNANGGISQSVLGRSGNGSGSSDAWTISFYFKAGTSNNTVQSIFYYGGGSVANDNGIHIYWNGNNGNNGRQQLVLRYGSNNNNLTFTTPTGTISNNNTWNHALISYDGGTTGSSSADINNYYSRFKIKLNNVLQTTINTHSNYGNTTALNGSVMVVGRYASGSGYMRNNCKVDELAIWDSDQSSNSTDIYNTGVATDLMLLSNQPSHWWRMGDNDTYPFLNDSGSVGSNIFLMSNMTSGDIVSDVP